MGAIGSKATENAPASQAEALPQVLVGHSMGAGCATAEVLEHSEVSAKITISIINMLVCMPESRTQLLGRHA